MVKLAIETTGVGETTGYVITRVDITIRRWANLTTPGDNRVVDRIISDSQTRVD